jgi:alpha-L-arabinofuranosidase
MLPICKLRLLFVPLLLSALSALAVGNDRNAVAPTADATVQVTGTPLILEILADRSGHPINRTQYGVFFEEISHAGQGGLYAELVNNRSFEDSITSIPNWEFYSNGVARGSIALETADLLNAAQSRALRLDVAAAGTVGVANGGYWGINVVKGRTYNLSFFAKSKLPPSAFITAKLQNSDGTRTFASCQIHHLADGWKKFTGSLTADDTDPKGRLALEITTEQAGALWMDVVSLFPPTWKGRPNGLRPELAEMVVRMKPGIIRFPGGSYVSTDPDKAPKWLTELGPIEDRPGHPAPGVKSPWGYRHNDGLGFHELLQFAEDLGAEPIYNFQGGAASRSELDKPETYIAGEPLDRLIQEILWGIEYANGAVTTTWGARRAANGHPAPFNMKFVEIGNENLSKPFHENYIRIYDAIKKKHPDIQVIWGGDWIGNNQHGYKSDGLMPEGSAAQIIDEHFYKKNNWFYENTDRYSPVRYPRGVPREAKVFLGEVSSQRDTLDAALKETAFLLGAEKYSDKVVMAVYAPLFANVNKKNWSANAINFDSARQFGTPSYYSQVMLANNRGDINIEVAGLESLVKSKVFANATLVKATGEVIAKIVNADTTPRKIRIQLRGLQKPPAAGREIVLTGPDLNAGNSFDTPMNVAPVEKQVDQVGNSFLYSLKPHSFTVLRLTP